jgi:hypothetical protein
MNHLNLECRLDRCLIDNTSEMEIKKCITQNDKTHPDRYNPCPYLRITPAEGYRKGDVWQKFGEIIDKSKDKSKGKLE